jgi:signal transduction histidine kinase
LGIDLAQPPQTLNLRPNERRHGCERWLALAQIAWVAGGASTAFLFVAAIPRGYAPRLADAFRQMNVSPPWYVAAGQVVSVASSLLAVLLSLGLAALLFWKRRADGMALFVSFYLLAHAVFIAGALEAFEGVHYDESSLLVQLGNAVYFVPPLLLLYLFPTGRFVPDWTRWTTALLLLMTPVIVFKDASQWGSPADPRTSLPLLAFCGLLVAGIYAQVYRYRRAATPIEQQQIKWVGFGIALYLVSLTITSLPYLVLSDQWSSIGSPWLTVSELLWQLVPGILPLVLTVAVMRYRLWAVDVLIHRTLVYGALTAGVGALYMVLVGGASAVSQTSGNLLVSLLATGLIAILFQPLRERLQRGVNRLLYGERDEPYPLMVRLGEQLETADAPDALLAMLAETIAQALKLPYAAIELAPQDGASTMVVHWPAEITRSPSTVLRLPLSHQQESVGSLLVAQRSVNEPLSAADLQLLRIIAQQTSMAVHAVRLSAELQHSREQLVVTREEERRRIRRDLHDGLGPALASLAMQADEAREWTHADPDTANRALAEITSKAQDALQDIRRLVYDLRPPALDDLGLIGALQQTAANAPNGLLITIEAREALPPLSAAVEAAAYRIAQEALNNVARHAHAQCGVVRLWVQDGLRLEISDDGVGLPTPLSVGVGLISMRERAVELGGSCVLSAAQGGGTRVSVQLPL